MFEELVDKSEPDVTNAGPGWVVTEDRGDPLAELGANGTVVVPFQTK